MLLAADIAMLFLQYWIKTVSRNFDCCDLVFGFTFAFSIFIGVNLKTTPFNLTISL